MLSWGIIGCGNIAHSFVKDLQLLGGHRLQAVASRTINKAQAFAQEYNVVSAYGDYNSLLSDKQVDVVYIATPHNSHLEWSIAAMNNKKHVLCEKPLAVNKKQVLTMLEAAKYNQVFLMEALWSRFNPTINEVKKKCDSAVLGELKQLHAEFSFKSKHPAESRLFNPQLAGGAILDVGIYPIFLAYFLFGYPDDISITAKFGDTGVDIQSSIILKYPDKQASLVCAINYEGECQSVVAGTKGRIVIPRRWHEAQGYREIIEGEEKSFSLPTTGKGYTYEILETARCISNGKLESSYWSHQDSINVISILDELRIQIGLKYPFE